jgi:hypothetical protein
VIPLLLTSLVYAGSFINRLWLLASMRGGDGDEVGIGCTQRLVLWIQTALDDVMVWRNYVVVCSSSLSHYCSVLIILIRSCIPVTEDFRVHGPRLVWQISNKWRIVDSECRTIITS